MKLSRSRSTLRWWSKAVNRSCFLSFAAFRTPSNPWGISRFSCMLFLSVRGFSDYAGPNSHSRLARLPYCLPPTRNGIGILIYGLFAAQSPRPPVPLSTLQETPRDVPGKTRGQDGFATSYPVGLLHPLQHAGLARRTPVCPSLGLWRRLGGLCSPACIGTFHA